MGYYDRTDLSEKIVAKRGKNKECRICQYFFCNHEFEFQNFKIWLYQVIVTGVGYHYIINDIRKSEAINLLENTMLYDRGPMMGEVSLKT